MFALHFEESWMLFRTWYMMVMCIHACMYMSVWVWLNMSVQFNIHVYNIFWHFAFFPSGIKLKLVLELVYFEKPFRFGVRFTVLGIHHK